MRKLVNDLTGKVYGRLHILGVDDNGKRKTYYICQCECGNIKSIRADALTSGATCSCGCRKTEQDKINLTKAHKHKMSGSRLYQIWQGMKDRCYDKTNSRYKDYGGRGIFVCDEWKKDFESFYKWSIENGYNDNLSIDRKNNNKEYAPYNCRWANEKEQSNNRRSNINITIGNETKTLMQWCEVFKMPYKTVYARIKREPDIIIDRLFRSERG